MPSAKSNQPRKSSFSGLEILILVLFLGSGAGALVYEVVWSRLLTYTFGGSAFAIATVLAAYMAGLALGSAWFGRRIDRRGHPLLVYGILELGIAVWAVILPLLLGGLDRTYAYLYRDLHLEGYGLAVVRFVLCFTVLLVPTTLMGGTLPVLGKILLARPGSLGARAALLYGANTIGAVAGVAGAGFALIPALGLRGATWVAVAVNVAVAVVAIAASRKLAYATPPAEAPDPASAPGADRGETRLRAAVLAVYAASGFAALAYEVAWTKTLSLLLGTSTYAFTSMLTTFLLGLALGSLLFGRIADRLRRTEGLLGVVQLGIPLFALLSIPALERIPQLYVDGFPALRDSWFSLELFRILLAGMVMFVPTLLMGGTFPLAARAYARQSALGTSLGRLYAFNTVGAILGSFLSGFVLVPLLGRQHTIVAASLVNLAAAGILLAAVRWGNIRRPMRLAVAATGALLVPAVTVALRPWDRTLISSGAYYYADRMAAMPSVEAFLEGMQYLYYEESTEAVVGVGQNLNLTTLRINGKIDASSHGDMVTQKLTGHLPAFYHPGRAQRGLVIGLASGASVGAMLTHDVGAVDVVELIEEVTGACRFFDPYNRRCLDDPRTNLIINDGRNQLKLTTERYDLIASVPTNPYVAGVGSLFTREYFGLIRDHLAPGGVFCQWFQLYHLRENDLRVVLATITEAFPHVHLWSGGEGDLFVIGSEAPLRLDPAALERQLAGAPGEDLAQVDALPAAHLLSYFLTDREGLLAFIGDTPKRVTDDNLYLEYAIPRYMFSGTWGGNVLVFDDVARSPATILAPPPDSAFAAELEAYREARNLARLALVAPERLPPGMSVETAMLRAHETAPRELLSRHWLANAYNERGIQDLQAGRTAEAVARFTQVTGFGDIPERALAWINVGVIAFQAGDVDSARACWERAAELEPVNPAMNYNLGLLAADRGDHAGAARHYGAALRYDPASADTRLRLAAAQAALGDADAARRTLAPVADDDGDPASAQRAREILDTL